MGDVLFGSTVCTGNMQMDFDFILKKVNRKIPNILL